ncbi:MAG: serine/threonine-protein kinase [Myxococcota bacterium]
MADPTLLGHGTLSVSAVSIRSTASSRSGQSYLHLFDLSQGGMGLVELTVRKEGKFERLYAVKRLKPASRDDPVAREMFVEEGRLAGLIQHPNVVPVLDVGEDAQGPYLAMEYIDGVSVRELVVSANREAVPMSVQMCCRIAAQAARGLAAAHQLRDNDGSPLELVHRDVSPHNILVGFDGIVRVADFGIARALGRDHRTSTGVLKGKLGYMAPEILRFRDATPASDLFSFGIVLYEMLTLERLYGGKDDGERARRILEEPPPDVGDVRPEVPPRVQALLLRLLAKDPSHRPATAAEVAQELERCAEALAEEEGPLEVADALAESFAPAREERQRAVQSSLRSLEEPPARSGGGRWSLVALVGAVAGLGATTAFFLSADSEPVDPAPDPPVEISLVSVPEGALVESAELRGAVMTPAHVSLVARTTPVEFEFRLPGYSPLREAIVPDVDQRLFVRLTPVAPAEETVELESEEVADEPDPPSARPVRPRRPLVRRPAKMRGFELFRD